ncbi:alpha-mannosidase [Paenibacillus koleovorans]|uniref:alpha-mannosidase n=1 Tax=Paenibacillus koleovorans TaxID=121608 RepID=UPI000FD83C28|nr:glycoside hydrolase family 38 C-terminal domain-containing protein [Paenibacillus koleovorans]
MKRVHVVPHTHWDREWYFSFQHYRMRLTRLIKKLLRLLEEDPDYYSFHLDGQSIVLKDYLEIHPEDEPRLRAQIEAGRIRIGPWYVQPDEALVSGEALVRNFEEGLRLAEQMGGGERFGYLPDMFGHTSQMPQILSGFGMTRAVMWRGIGEAATGSSELRWVGSDGTEMFVHRFPDEYGYSAIYRLHGDPVQAAAQIRDLVERHLAPYATSDTLLVTVGVDHMEPQENLSVVLREARQLLPEYELIPSKFERFLQEAEQGMKHASQSAQGVPILQGELRDTSRASSGVITFLLPNVLSSRMPIKQANFRAQLLLERWAEPWTALLDCAQPYTQGEAPDALLHRSWGYLLENHPHDSICGCSRDEVHRQMMTRFEWSTEIAEQAVEEALNSLMAQADVSWVPEGGIPLIVFNPLERDREDVVTAELWLPVDCPPLRTVEIRDASGSVWPCQIVGDEPAFRGISHPDLGVRDLAGIGEPFGQPENKAILVGFEHGRKLSIRFVPGVVPAMGYKSFAAIPRRSSVPQEGTLLKGHTLENPFLRAEVREDGRVSLLDKATGRIYEDLLVYEDSGDIGDGYTYSPPLLDERFTTSGMPARISVVEDGPAQAALRVEREWALPESASPDRKRRSARTVVCRLTTIIRLGATHRWLSVETLFDNRARDHRLRVALPVGTTAPEYSWSSAAFDCVRRPVGVVQPAPDVWIEDAPSVHPNHGVIGMPRPNREGGLAVGPYGLPEYEAARDGTLYVTLLRSTGYLGSPDALTISIGAGPTFETPEGQCLGQHRFSVAVMPYDGSNESEPLHRANEHHLPARAVQQKRHKGTLPPELSFCRFGGGEDKLVFSSMRRLADGTGVRLRVFNPTDEPVKTELLWWTPLLQAHAVNLAGDRVGELAVIDRTVPLRLEPKKIMTIDLIARTAEG